jgi:hypothetical protein
MNNHWKSKGTPKTSSTETGTEQSEEANAISEREGFDVPKKKKKKAVESVVHARTGRSQQHRQRKIS